MWVTSFELVNLPLREVTDTSCPIWPQSRLPRGFWIRSVNCLNKKWLMTIVCLLHDYRNDESTQVYYKQSLLQTPGELLLPSASIYHHCTTGHACFTLTCFEIFSVSLCDTTDFKSRTVLCKPARLNLRGIFNLSSQNWFFITATITIWLNRLNW